MSNYGVSGFDQCPKCNATQVYDAVGRWPDRWDQGVTLNRHIEGISRAAVEAGMTTIPGVDDNLEHGTADDAPPFSLQLNVDPTAVVGTGPTADFDLDIICADGSSNAFATYEDPGPSDVGINERWVMFANGSMTRAREMVEGVDFREPVNSIDPADFWPVPEVPAVFTNGLAVYTPRLPAKTWAVPPDAPLKGPLQATLGPLRYTGEFSAVADSYSLTGYISDLQPEMTASTSVDDYYRSSGRTYVHNVSGIGPDLITDESDALRFHAVASTYTATGAQLAGSFACLAGWSGNPNLIFQNGLPEVTIVPPLSYFQADYVQAQAFDPRNAGHAAGIATEVSNVVVEHQGGGIYNATGDVVQKVYEGDYLGAIPGTVERDALLIASTSVSATAFGIPEQGTPNYLAPGFGSAGRWGWSAPFSAPPADMAKLRIKAAHSPSPYYEVLLTSKNALGDTLTIVRERATTDPQSATALPDQAITRIFLNGAEWRAYSDADANFTSGAETAQDWKITRATTLTPDAAALNPSVFVMTFEKERPIDLVNYHAYRDVLLRSDATIIFDRTQVRKSVPMGVTEDPVRYEGHHTDRHAHLGDYWRVSLAADLYWLDDDAFPDANNVGGRDGVIDWIRDSPACDLAGWPAVPLDFGQAIPAHFLPGGITSTPIQDRHDGLTDQHGQPI